MPSARRFVPGRFPRLHLVTPAAVERTIARLGIDGVLNDRERAVFERFDLEKRRRDWIAGRLAAKRAVRAAVRRASKVTLSYPAITLWNDSDGSPQLTVDGHPGLADELNVSLAHADGTAVAAVAWTASDGFVGVDVEPLRALDLAIVHRVLRPSEIALMDGRMTGPDPLAIWVVKEAAFKAARTACSALRDVEVEWTTGPLLSARIARVSAPPHSLTVGHRTAGTHAFAVALYRPTA